MTATTADDLPWLIEHSMLHSANVMATRYSGQGRMWQQPYAAGPTACGSSIGLGLVHRLPASHHHQSRASRCWPPWAIPHSGPPLQRSASGASTRGR